jgi:hypothetical protein
MSVRFCPEADKRADVWPSPLSANSVLTHRSNMASPLQGSKRACGAIFQTGTLYFGVGASATKTKV